MTERCDSCGHTLTNHGYIGCYWHSCSCELPFGVHPADGPTQAWYQARQEPVALPPDLRVFAHLADAVRRTWDENPTVARFALLELD